MRRKLFAIFSLLCLVAINVSGRTAIVTWESGGCILVLCDDGYFNAYGKNDAYMAFNFYYYNHKSIYYKNENY